MYIQLYLTLLYMNNWLKLSSGGRSKCVSSLCPTWTSPAAGCMWCMWRLSPCRTTQPAALRHRRSRQPGLWPGNCHLRPGPGRAGLPDHAPCWARLRESLNCMTCLHLHVCVCHVYIYTCVHTQTYFVCVKNIHLHIHTHTDRPNNKYELFFSWPKRTHDVCNNTVGDLLGKIRPQWF